MACGALAIAPRASVQGALGASAGGIAPAAPSVRNGWPCAGCLVEVPAGYRRGHPAALLVVLHGDEGAPGLIANAFGPIASSHNMIMFAPQCPTALGCRFANGTGGDTNSWWSWLQYSQTYDDAWVGDQVARIESAYDLDRTREYLVGWSGGADYLGWYAFQHSASFAGAAFLAGGVPYHPSCPATHLAAYFLDGAADPRYLSGQPLQVRSILAHCGDKTKLVVIPGADHEGSLLAASSPGTATSIVRWLLQQHS